MYTEMIMKEAKIKLAFVVSVLSVPNITKEANNRKCQTCLWHQW